MNKTWQRYLELANGLGQVTQRGAETVVKTLVKQGEIAADLAERAVDDLLSRSEANRRAARAMVGSEMERAIARLGLVRQEEIERLRARIEHLESQVAAGGAGPGTGPAKSSSARTSRTKSSGGTRRTTTRKKKKDAEVTQTEGPAADTPPES